MGVLVAALMVAFTTKGVMAQEKAKAEKAAQEPKAKVRPPATVLFENDRVRVFETRTQPGERNAMQERPHRVIFTISMPENRESTTRTGKQKTENSNRVVLSSASEIRLPRRILGRPKFTI